MSDEITENKDRFDAVLRRMLDMKPMTAKELSAKLKAEKKAKTVQKMDKSKVD
jgi:hypothetical protein